MSNQFKREPDASKWRATPDLRTRATSPNIATWSRSLDRIRDAIGKGQSLAAIKAARILRDYDGRYGAQTGSASADAFLDAA